jgi:hypothetical protein
MVASAYKQQKSSKWGRDASSPLTSFATTSKPGQVEQQRPGTSGGGGRGDEGGDSWGFFDLQRYSYRWDVPWGPGKVLGGMALWFGSFVAVGVVVVPGLYRIAGERADVSCSCTG